MTPSGMPKRTAITERDQTQAHGVDETAIPHGLTFSRLKQDVLYVAPSLAVGRAEVTPHRVPDVAKELTIERIAALQIKEQGFIQTKARVQ